MTDKYIASTIDLAKKMKTDRTLLAHLTFILFAWSNTLSRGEDLLRPGDISSVSGIRFPMLPESLDRFEGDEYLNSVVVPNPLPKLSKEEKTILRGNILQVCAIVESVVIQEQTISTESPIWHAIVEYFPSIKDENTLKKVVAGNRVSLIALGKVLHFNKD